MSGKKASVIIAIVAVLIVVGFIWLVRQPTFVERQIAAGKVVWTEVLPPPDSSFERCWVGAVGDNVTLRISFVCE